MMHIHMAAKEMFLGTIMERLWQKGRGTNYSKGVNKPVDGSKHRAQSTGGRLLVSTVSLEVVCVFCLN
jgi:hypothetical protein